MKPKIYIINYLLQASLVASASA